MYDQYHWVENSLVQMSWLSPIMTRSDPYLVGGVGLLEIIYYHSDSLTITRPPAYQRKFLSICVVLEFMQNDEKSRSDAFM